MIARLLLLLFCLCGAHGSAVAYGTLPTVGVPEQVKCWQGKVSSQCYASAAAGCGSFSGSYPVFGQSRTYFVESETAMGATCGYNYVWLTGSDQTSYYGGNSTIGAYYETQTTYQCPANSLEAGTGCICNLGYKVSGSSCVPYACHPAGSYDAVTRPDVEVTTRDTHQCVGGCQVIATGVNPSPDGKLWAHWPYYYLGADKMCGGGTATAPLGDPLKPEDSTGSSTGEEAPLPCEAGQYSGQVNGVDKCIDAVGGDTVTSKDVVNPDGTIDRATTRCVSGGCVTTTERINADGTKTPGSTTIGGSDVDAPGEGDGDGSSSGGGGGPDGEEACPEGSQRAGCMGLGELVAEGIPNSSPGLGITPVAAMGAAAAACPAPRTVTLMGQSFSFPWQPFCDLADGIKPVVVGLAWVTAIFGFMGIGRKD